MILFLTTFFLVFTAVCAKNIRYGVYAVIFSMPLYLIRFSILGIPTTILEIMIYILFLTWILDWMSKQYHSTVYGTVCAVIKKGRDLLLVVGIILLFLGLILSTLHSSDLRTSLGIGKGWFLDPFLFFIVFISVIKKTEHIKSSLASWVFSGVVVSAISLLYLLNNELTFDGRLKAFYISPNYLAMYISPVFLIVLFFLNNNLSFLRRQESTATTKGNLRVIRNIKKISKIQNSIFLIIVLTPLFFTYSYGAFLGIFAGAVWLFYKTQTCHSDRTTIGVSGGICERIKCVSKVVLKRKCNYVYRFLRFIPLLSSLHSSRNDKSEEVPMRSFLKILAFIILVTFISITAVKFNQITSSESRSSFHSRLMIWNASMEIIKDNPVFGIGPGTFQEVYLSYSEKFDEPYLEWAVTQPHNTFLAFYLQTGLIGFIGFILILFWFFKNGLKYKNNIQYPVSNISMILIIYFLVHSLVDTMYWKNDLSLMFWLIIGLLCKR